MSKKNLNRTFIERNSTITTKGVYAVCIKEQLNNVIDCIEKSINYSNSLYGNGTFFYNELYQQLDHIKNETQKVINNLNEIIDDKTNYLGRE